MRKIKNLNGFVFALRAKPLHLLCCFIALAAGGCSSMGSRAMRGERVHLNTALQQTNDEQLLINLVRLRYRDTPAFLEVSSISSQSRFDASLTAGAELERNTAHTDIFTFEGSAGYATQPTITYTPLQGDNFIQRLLTPLTLEKLILLNRSGWNIRRVFLLCVQRMNHVKNAPRASGPTPGRAPEYREFLQAVGLLRELEKMDVLTIAFDTEPAGEGPVALLLSIGSEASDLPEAMEFRRILNLTPGKTMYPIVYSQWQHSRFEPQTFIGLESRSLLSMMFFLSQAVEVPETDVKKGNVTVTLGETDEPFDWGQVMGDSFRVRAAALKPVDAAISVRYRGHWFYISDSDLESKSTFAMLSQIFALQAGKAEGILPVLTLPLGR